MSRKMTSPGSRHSSRDLPAFLVKPFPAKRGRATPTEHRVDVPPERFGDRVAARRQKLHLSQATMIQQVNRILGTDLGRTSASVWENGHAEPSLRIIRGVAKVLNTQPEYLAFGVRTAAGSGDPDRTARTTRH